MLTYEPTPQWLKDWLAEPTPYMVRRYASYHPQQKRWQRWEWDARPPRPPNNAGPMPDAIAVGGLQVVEIDGTRAAPAPGAILASVWTHPVLAHDLVP